MALGFKPIKAAAVALIANTAPVAFGALATPIVTLATVSSGASDDPGLTVDTLGAMVGRQTPILASSCRWCWCSSSTAAAACARPGCPRSSAVSPSASPSSSPPTTSPSRSPTSSPPSSPPPPSSCCCASWQPGRGARRRGHATSERRRGADAARRHRPAAAAAPPRRATGGAADGPVRDTGARGRQGLRAVRRDHRDLLDRQHPRRQGVPGREAVHLRLHVARASTC